MVTLLLISWKDGATSRARPHSPPLNIDPPFVCNLGEAGLARRRRLLPMGEPTDHTGPARVRRSGSRP